MKKMITSLSLSLAVAAALTVAAPAAAQAAPTPVATVSVAAIGGQGIAPAARSNCYQVWVRTVSAWSMLFGANTGYWKTVCRSGGTF